MSKLGIYIYVFSLSIGLVFFLSDSAFAYLDPSTGSYFFQIMIAAFLGGLFAVKTFGKNVFSKFKGFFGKDSTDK